MFIVMNRDEFVASVTNIETALGRESHGSDGDRVKHEATCAVAIYLDLPRERGEGE